VAIEASLFHFRHMKRLLLLPVLLSLFAIANAQNERWIYLLDDPGNTYMVDTAANDIKQYDNYNGRENIVLIRVKAINKQAAFVGSAILHYAVDTANEQIETLSVATYHGDSLILSKTYDQLPWEAAIPESSGGFLIFFCRALHNPKLMNKLILNAQSHDLKPPSDKRTN
jgi:hypothetical protein